MTPDPILIALLAMVESEHSSSVPITLNVHGLVVSGLLCSRSEYEVHVEMLIARHSAQPENPGAADFHELVRDHERKIKTEIDPDYGFGDFIHLKDAQFITGTAVFNHPLPWRGKLSSVDAFSLARILVSNAEHVQMADIPK